MSLLTFGLNPVVFVKLYDQRFLFTKEGLLEFRLCLVSSSSFELCGEDGLEPTGWQFLGNVDELLA